MSVYRALRLLERNWKRLHLANEIVDQVHNQTTVDTRQAAIEQTLHDLGIIQRELQETYAADNARFHPSENR